MATIDLTTDDFEETVLGDGIVLVDFWADWCGPCKSFAPVFEEASEQHPDVSFTKVDTEAEQQIAGALQIRSIPTLMIFRDGVQLFSQPGALPAHALEDLIGQVKALDMDEVHAAIAKEKAAEAPGAADD
jgi:thioredoxin